MKNLLYLLVVIPFFSCVTNVEGDIGLTQKNPMFIAIDELDTDKKKKEYLERIYKEDQRVREEEIVSNQNFGYKSKEHTKTLKQMMEMDGNNLKLIEYYLNKHGHPTIKVHGKSASFTPWTVIHHAQTIEARERNFKYLHEAYLNEDIRETEFLFYLNRWYRMKYNKEFENPIGENEIDNLIEVLE